MDKIDGTDLMQVVLVVKDIQKTAENYSRVFNIPMPEIRTLSSSKDAPVYYNGELAEFSIQIAVLKFGGVYLELIRPLDGVSCWKDFLDTYGEGVHNIGFYVGDRDSSLRALEQNGSKVLHAGYSQDESYIVVDSKKELGVRLNIKHKGEDNGGLIEKHPQTYKSI